MKKHITKLITIGKHRDNDHSEPNPIEPYVIEQNNKADGLMSRLRIDP
jgi:hypothetical protein